MAELSTLARPYAKAAFEYARAQDALGEWSKQLGICAAVVGDNDVRAMLDNPSLTNEQQAQMLNAICAEATGPQIKNFVTILSSNKRIALLAEIHAQFELFKANQEKSVDVEVISAFDMEDATATKIAGVLSKKLQRDIKVSTATDQNLLGGILIRAGDLVIDGSVRGRLNKLAEAMNS